MVRGIETFRTYFKDYADKYIIIGGTALDMLTNEAGLTPRATQDIDMVLVVEALDRSFLEAFWEFVKDGNYEQKQKGKEKLQYYRFVKPENKEYPKQLELFAKTPGILDLGEDTYLTPIPTEEELSSLSAILMDEDYYKFTMEQSTLIDDIRLAKPSALIVLKAKAFLDWSKRKAEGQAECDKHIKKHRADILRATALMSGEEQIGTPQAVRADLIQAAILMEAQLPDSSIFKHMGIVVQPEIVFTQFKQIFKLS